MVQTCVDGGDGEGDERRDGGKQGMVNHCNAQDPERMAAQAVPVGGDKQKPRTDERSEEHEDAEIPDAVGIDVEFTRGVERKHQRQQKPRSGNCAVGRDDERAEVEEDWMHSIQDSRSGDAGSECEECRARIRASK